MREHRGPAGWDAFVGRHRVGDPLAVTVTRTLPFGALVAAEGVAGLLTGTDRSTCMTNGQVVPGRIAEIDVARRRFHAVAA